MIRVLIADDQTVVRRNLRLILNLHDDIQVIGEACDGRSAVDLARRLRPDVVLADIRMPVLDGLELTKILAGPDVAEPMRVVVVTTFDLDEYVHAALRHGACGFLLKRSGPALLAEAVRAAVAGDALISPSVTVRLLRRLNATAPVSSASEPLTPREIEIAGYVASGLTNAEIGRELYISAGTVKTHVASIQRKLQVRNRVGIALWAKDNGLVP
ncbi:response regulator [Nocardia wallacei]|uniref:DNA-binding response regulator n=1 Tax=Nocardia wallacei TaxID=480035 RepID=A0A7G1KXY3_9NOCA|nr:response regulator transcription factor [Nocardia wallacei]BCK59123.1 DNA-binding response regulator [Nocardia wallacei]